MGGKKCCIDNCNSSSTRKEDAGVTYHKYPKDATIRDIWVAVTLQENITTEPCRFVCSRHFRKSDFQIYKESKYILKSDAIPSIFPWTNINNMDSAESTADPLPEDSNPEDPTSGDNPNPEDLNTEDLNPEVFNKGEICLNDSNETEGENLEAIKKFIEEQEKEILQLEATVKPGPSRTVGKLSSTEIDLSNSEHTVQRISEVSTDVDVKQIVQNVEPNEGSVKPNIKEEDAANVLNIMLNDSDMKRKLGKSPKKSLSPGVGNSSMALAVGSKVEAKDFSELWYAAQIVEVDYDEMEVLVRYDNLSKKHDEWISVSSPRLRPLGSGVDDEIEPPMTSYDQAVAEIIPLKEDIKKEIVEKPKLTFKVGERCLARWRDNRKFMAIISEELGDDQYKIKFDDGTDWQCNVTRLCKIRETSPMLDPTPEIGTVLTVTPYNTHLFDPARDYLGSKSERRALKRKINIKEIFNIGQKKKKEDIAKKPKIVKKKLPVVKMEVKTEIKTEQVMPEAVASIIGATKTETTTKETKPNVESESNIQPVVQTVNDEPVIAADSLEVQEFKITSEQTKEILEDSTETVKEVPQMRNMKVVLQKMDVSKMSSAVKDEEMEVVTIDINDGDLDSSVDDGDHKIDLDDMEESILAAYEAYVPQTPTVPVSEPKDRITLKIGKDKLLMKPKKKKASHEEKVKSKVEKVKNEIAEMKRRMAEMKKQSQLYKQPPIEPLPESVLLPGQWCCRWVNGQPVGAVSELRGGGTGGGLPRRSVQVDDKRLPPGWTKHMVRRSQGNSAGKWDIVIISPDLKRFHNKTDMKNYMEAQQDDSLKPYEDALMDFGAHRKLSRRLGWEVTTDETYDVPVTQFPAQSAMGAMSPLVKRGSISMARRRHERRRDRKKLSLRRKHEMPQLFDQSAMDVPSTSTEVYPPLEEGYVYVGSLKVQILENLLRCPADGCFKNFRNTTLLQMHIKHYHKELISKMGATPKVLDLASARTKAPVIQEEYRPSKVKTIKAPRYFEEVKSENLDPDQQIDVTAVTPSRPEQNRIPRSQDSPRLRNALINTKANKRPKVLLPVRKPDENMENDNKSLLEDEVKEEIKEELLDIESVIATNVLPKEHGKKPIRKKLFVNSRCPTDESDSDFDGRSSAPRSVSPDKMLDASPHPLSSESNDAANQYMLTESGEKVKIVHMKREEIINCHCGLREEDGLMIQCELCLCWQHALCHNIQREAEVPDKYTCSICLNPRRGRRSRRFLHDQDRMLEGLLPGSAPSEPLKRAHELSGNLVRIDEALHALRVKFYVATKKDHPKLYLWAKEWDATSLQADYLDLGALVRDLGKENMPSAVEDLDPDRLSQSHGNLGSQALLSGLLSSPGGVSLDLPISTSELESLAKTVQESELGSLPSAPQPEAAIEDSACRARLLRHVQRCQALVDARLDSIEAQVAELESQDPSFEDDETAEHCPRAKQTIQMLLRDLDTMEELGLLT